jgi:hypothetical protein
VLPKFITSNFLNSYICTRGLEETQISKKYDTVGELGLTAALVQACGGVCSDRGRDDAYKQSDQREFWLDGRKHWHQLS